MDGSVVTASGEQCIRPGGMLKIRAPAEGPFFCALPGLSLESRIVPAGESSLLVLRCEEKFLPDGASVGVILKGGGAAEPGAANRRPSRTVKTGGSKGAI